MRTSILVLLLLTDLHCFKDYPDTLLPQKMDVVMAVMAPDTAVNFVRPYPIEVFVGKLVPTNTRNFFLVRGMLDSVLLRLMLGTRVEYTIYYEFDSTAVVSISVGNQSSVLSYVGAGIYRDVTGSVSIREKDTCRLEVLKEDGRILTAETSVPADLAISNIPEDTITVEADSNGTARYPITIATTDTPFYYVRVSKVAYFDPTIYVYSFPDELFGYVNFVSAGAATVEVSNEIRGVNRDLGRFEHPCDFSFTFRFNDYLLELEAMTIREKSNIQGEDVVGVFGAYNATRKQYVVRRAN